MYQISDSTLVLIYICQRLLNTAPLMVTDGSSGERTGFLALIYSDKGRHIPGFR